MDNLKQLKDEEIVKLVKNGEVKVADLIDFGILKQEIYYGNTFYSFEELKNTIEKYIVYYNNIRIKEKINWMSPIEYRLNQLAAVNIHRLSRWHFTFTPIRLCHMQCLKAYNHFDACCFYCYLLPVKRVFIFF